MRLLGELDRAEDCFSEAIELALQKWPAQGLPNKPAAWLNTVARRKALDFLRREKVLASKLPLTLEDEPEEDDRLSLIFTCCHPALSEEARVALTLRTLGGLSTPEIARAFLVPESTMAQRIVRAQRKIKEAGIPYRVPPPELLQPRLDGVLAVLYLIFNEGYWASTGAQLVRTDLCQEALHLAQMLVELMPHQAEPAGLLALMLFQHSRRRARLGPEGEAVSLEEQDRSRWDRRDIARGLEHLDRATVGKGGPYTVQAAIAAMHCLAPTAAATDWPRIVSLYQSLPRTPIVTLNQAVAVGMAGHPEQALTLLDQLELEDYAPYHASRAEFLKQLDRLREAREAYQTALSLEQNHPARRLLEKKLRECN